VVAAAVVVVNRKRLIREWPMWIWVPTIAAITGILAACALWAAAHLLEWLQPERVWPPLDTVWPRDSIRGAATAAAIVVLAFLFVFRASHGFTRCWPEKPEKWRTLRAWGSLLLATLGSAIAAFGLFWGIGTWLDSLEGDAGLWKTIAFGAPLILSALSVVVVVQLGLLGAHFPDEQREWWSRLRAWTLIYSIVWTLLFVLALFPPVWSQDLTEQMGKWGGAGAALVWILSTIAGIRTAPRAAVAEKQAHESAKPAPAGPQPQSARVRLKSTLLKALATVAPYIFIVGLLCAVSLATDAILAHIEGNGGAGVWIRFTEYPKGVLGLTALALFFASVFLSWRIGVNEFSMHHFYKNRLVRCYLGASRWKERKADWFTGFDRQDDLPISRFDHKSPAAGGGARYAGPYPIINAALNLVAGEDLAWQERKAAPFVFTPKYCGYDLDRAVLNKGRTRFWPDAYAPTRRYSYNGRGPMLGMAMAISGAAASPNMGRATSPATAFLMTLFNVRLGWWLPNPRRLDCLASPSPPLGVSYTALELFGLTDDKTQFVNVSDGGHFENLGVYELIRRGCRYIVACDAGQDGSFGLEDLGNLVRKCRVDFGVDIDIGADLIRNRDSRGWSEVHCVVGKIHYRRTPRCDAFGRVMFEQIPKRDASGNVMLDADKRVIFENGAPLHEEGLLVYIKPSISGDEPYDVLEYQKRVPEFPHESTGDQWFNESQFESYRQLGLHIAETAFKRYARDDQPLYPPYLFDRLKSFWHPPSPKITAYSTKHTLEYSRIMELIRSREDFSYLDPVLFDGIRKHGVNIDNRDEFYLCNSLIQLMEDVYADLDLEQNYDHPHVSGWMRVFRKWARQPEFQRTWAISQNTYAERFQNFYYDRLENGGPYENGGPH
jgi:hypothetical protein